MKGLTIVGTAAMFLVGGGIITHGIPLIHHQLEAAIQVISYPTLTTLGYNFVIGLMAGAICLTTVNLVKKTKAWLA